MIQSLLAAAISLGFIYFCCYQYGYVGTCERCTMSFMLTDYSLIDVPGDQPYSLLRYTHPNFPAKPDPRSIPVIFIPGNRGSYKQVRTLGSWLAQHHGQSQKPFTIYTVDLKEQFSVLSNKVLRQQRQFVKDAIKILEGRHNEKRFILVGHSMGAIVARLAMADLNPQNFILFTLAAPQTSPILEIDPHDPIDYQSLPIETSLTINLSGGWADAQVLPFESKQADKVQNLNTETIPLVWASTHHQAIVWVHPVIEYIGRSIHKIVK